MGSTVNMAAWAGNLLGHTYWSHGDYYGSEVGLRHPRFPRPVREQRLARDDDVVYALVHPHRAGKEDGLLPLLPSCW